MQRILKNHATKLRFGIVGSINTGLDFGILFALTLFFNLPREVANTISTTVGFIFSFIANRKFTFKSSSDNLRKQLTLFIAVTLFGLWIIQNGVIAAITPFFINLGCEEAVALFISKLVATAASLTWNYALYTKVVFKN